MNYIEINGKKLPFFVSAATLIELEGFTNNGENPSMKWTFDRFFKALEKGCEKTATEFPYTKESLVEEVGLNEMTTIFTSIRQEVIGEQHEKKPGSPKGKKR